MRHAVVRRSAAVLTARRRWAVAMLLAVAIPAGCANVQRSEYWQGYYLHVFDPRYTFRVPDGWREATPADYPAFGFNRRIAQGLDEAGRRAFLEVGEREMKARDTVLISLRGGWIHAGSERTLGSRYTLDDRLTDAQKQAIWQRLSERLMAAAPATDKPTLSLRSMDIVYYGQNIVLELRFVSVFSRGAMHWTALFFFGSTHVVSIAHVGIPEDAEEGIAGLDVIARSFRFD